MFYLAGVLCWLFHLRCILLPQDENKDGVFTVEELIKWIDEHKLVKFVEEDSDADMDRVVESQVSSQQKEEDLSSAEPLAKKQ